jgi:hypothetical protein
MKLVRDERKTVGKPGVGTQHLKPLKKPVPISRATSVATVPDRLDVHNWSDPSWFGDEPNWGDLLAPGADRPKVADDWNSHWENVWRWLYRLADSHGLNSFDRTVYAGFKKISASIGDLWLDLSKVRRLMNMTGMQVDPKGIGCQQG